MDVYRNSWMQTATIGVRGDKGQVAGLFGRPCLLFDDHEYQVDAVRRKGVSADGVVVRLLRRSSSEPMNPNYTYSSDPYEWKDMVKDFIQTIVAQGWKVRPPEREAREELAPGGGDATAPCGTSPALVEPGADGGGDATAGPEQDATAVFGTLPLPVGWQEFRTEEGVAYYYHADTKTTQWASLVEPESEWAAAADRHQDEPSQAPKKHRSVSGCHCIYCWRTLGPSPWFLGKCATCQDHIEAAVKEAWPLDKHRVQYQVDSILMPSPDGSTVINTDFNMAMVTVCCKLNAFHLPTCQLVMTEITTTDPRIKAKKRKHDQYGPDNPWLVSCASLDIPFALPHVKRRGVIRHRFDPGTAEATVSLQMWRAI